MTIPTRDEALPGREDALPTAGTHFVNGQPPKPPFPDRDRDGGLRPWLLLGRGAEVLDHAGVYFTSVGYGG